MMLLPKTIDPIKFAKQKMLLRGKLPLADCSRLQDISDQENNQASVDLEFGQDEARIYFIRGNIDVTVNLICQRCNSPMSLKMDISFLLSPVASEERAKKLPNRYEPIFMKDELISISNMIEDEILLALPMIPKHERCESL